MLSFIDPDLEYREWFKIAAALKHQYEEDAEKGYDLFDRWSAVGGKYNQDSKQTTEIVWSRVQAEPGGKREVTAAFIKKIAVENGYVPIKKQKEQKKEIVPVPKGKTHWTNQLIYVLNASSYYNWIFDQKIPLKSVNACFNRYLDEGSAVTYLSKCESIPIVSDYAYYPCEPLPQPPVFSINGKLFANTYRKPKAIAFTKEDYEFTAKTLENHMQYLFKLPSDRKLFMSFLAYPFQNMGERVKWCLVIQGVSGSGKSVIGDVLINCLGVDNIQRLIPHQMKGDFQGWATDKMFVLIEEMKAQGDSRFSVMEKLKTFITNLTVSVEKKYENVGDLKPNVSNYMIFTEFKSAVPVAENDRRYGLLWSQIQDISQVEEKKRNGGFNDIFRLTNKKYRSSIYEYLKNYKISPHFDPNNPPDNSNKDGAKCLSWTDLDHILSEVYLMNDEMVTEQVISLTRLRMLLDLHFPNYRYSLSSIVTQLIEKGYVRHSGERASIKGERHTLFFDYKLTDSEKTKLIEGFRK